MQSTEPAPRLETKHSLGFASLSYRLSALGFVVLTLPVISCTAKSVHEGKSVAELERMLRQGDSAQQAAAAFGLSQRGADARSAAPALIEALGHRDPLVRQNAALALGAIGPDASESVPALIKALGDSEWTVRRQAATALGQIGPAAKSAAPELRKRERDEHSLVRRAAAEAIGRIGS